VGIDCGETVEVEAATSRTSFSDDHWVGGPRRRACRARRSI
jgi:hypothetical protein